MVKTQTWLIIVAAATMALQGCKAEDKYARALFDDQIPYSQVLVSKLYFADKYYGCTFAGVQLTDAAPTAPPTYSLQERGQGKYWTWNLKFGGDWQASPLSDQPKSEMTVYAKQCMSELPDDVEAMALKALSEEGSWYILKQRSYESTFLYIYSPKEKLALKFRHGD